MLIILNTCFTSFNLMIDCSDAINDFMSFLKCLPSAVCSSIFLFYNSVCYVAIGISVPSGKCKEVGDW